MAAPSIARAAVYYVRHGETDWNVLGRLQGRRDVPLNARGRAQAIHCGEILRDLFARDSRDPASLDYVSSPLGRACQTMELMRAALGLDEQGYRREPRLAEIAFGEWEGFTIAQLHERDPQRIAQREHDKWHFLPPGGESYEMVSARMRDWYESLAADTVVAGHGGTARGLIAFLGIAKPAAAPLVDIAQGVVYVFQGGAMTRYASDVSAPSACRSAIEQRPIMASWLSAPIVARCRSGLSISRWHWHLAARRVSTSFTSSSK